MPHPQQSCTDEPRPGSEEIARLTNALARSEDRYHRMLENLKEEFLFYRHDPRGIFTHISPSYKNILGYDSHEYIGKRASDLWTPNPVNKQAEHNTRLSCEGVRQPPYEIEIYHKDGSTRRFVTIETPIVNEGGKVIGVEGTARDITEKRKTEEQLDKYRLMLEELVVQRTQELEISRKELADIIEFLPYPIFVIDTQKTVIAWNRAMVKLTGTRQKQVIGEEYSNWLDTLYQKNEPVLAQLVLDGLYDTTCTVTEDLQARLNSHGIKVENGKVMSEKTILHSLSANEQHLWVTAGPILGPDNKIIGAIESIRDVTQVKQAEKHRLKSEQRLYTLMNNLPGMAYRISYSEGEWFVDFVSNGCFQIFGLDPSNFIGKNLRDLKYLIHPEDLPTVIDKAKNAIEESILFECEYRICTAADETKWVFDKAEIIPRNVDGKFSVEGFMADFTVFKTMESRLRNENSLLRSTIGDRYKFNNIIGNCRAMQDVYEHILKAATSDDSVFIYGESGTGKELVAHAIHETSSRKDKEFVAVNCAAIPESLIESEFFGTAKGAYTGAHATKQGYLEIADGGTLFLDEIGDISLNLQVKLLRAIDGGGFSPVGSRRVIRPNLRIIAASNKDLQQLVEAGNIRQDFFFRIHVIPIHLPPLRERGDDIYMLITHFLKEYGGTENLTSLSWDELEHLKNYHWPGNVRELQNVIRRFLTMKNLHFIGSPGQGTPQSPPKVIPPAALARQDLKDAVLQLEKQIILQTLDETRWNKTKAAQQLGVSRKTLFRKMKACGLQ